MWRNCELLQFMREIYIKSGRERTCLCRVLVVVAMYHRNPKGIILKTTTVYKYTSILARNVKLYSS